MVYLSSFVIGFAIGYVGAAVYDWVQRRRRNQ